MVRTKHAISYFYVKPKIIVRCQLLMDQWQRHLNFREPTGDNPWPSCSKSHPRLVGQTSKEKRNDTL